MDEMGPEDTDILRDTNREDGTAEQPASTDMPTGRHSSGEEPGSPMSSPAEA